MFKALRNNLLAVLISISVHVVLVLMLFIGFVDGEFKFYTVHDEIMVLEKSLIQKEILITSKIIIVIVAE